jgi:tetratricopeptide (TPR) repeat protein
MRFFEESLALAEATGDPELRWAAREPFEFALLLVGDLVPALRMNDEQIAFSRTDPAIGVAMVGFSTGFSFSHRGWILTDLGRFDEAAEAFRRGEELARRFNENEIVSMNEAMRARLFERTGDVQAALSTGRRAVESAERIGSHVARALAHGYYGTALGLNAEWQAARQSLALALEIARANRVGLILEADFASALAEAHLGLGDSPRARALAGDAIQVALRMDLRVAEVRAQLALARVRRAVDGADASANIAAALDQAQALVQSTGARSYEPQIYVERARLAALRSDPSGAQQWLREAHRLFTEMGATGHAERLAQELGS